MGQTNRLADRDGLPPGVTIRAPRPAEAAALLAFGDKVFGETTGFMRMPGERAADVAEMHGIIQAFRDGEGYFLRNAWEGDTPVGEVMLVRGPYRRNRGTASVGVGVLEKFWGTGVGPALMRAAEDQAKAWRLHRIELTVFETNPRARAFYRRLGYREEGVKRQSVRINGAFVDEIMMAKLLTEGVD